MNLYAYSRGKEHDVFLFEVHENRDVKAFITNLIKSSKKDAAPLLRRLDATAKEGIVWNPAHVRALRHNAKPICEFKGGQARILWFQDKFDSRNLICTNAFTKKGDQTPPSDINTAHGRMKLFYANREKLLKETKR